MGLLPTQVHAKLRNMGVSRFGLSAKMPGNSGEFGAPSAVGVRDGDWLAGRTGFEASVPLPGANSFFRLGCLIFPNVPTCSTFIA
jgi:hypothetical protein